MIMLVVPLGAASLRTLRDEQWIGATESASEQWVHGTGWRVESVKQEGGDIVITAVGPAEPPPVESLRAAVRREVPRRIDVSIVEGGGKTIEL